MWANFGRMTAQSTAFVLQGGLTAGLQKWDNSFDREPLFAEHVALSIESVDNEKNTGSIFLQIGYHVKGSALRFRYYDYNSGFPGGVSTEPYKFRNLSLVLGAKQKFVRGTSGTSRYYYFGGVRGDYTVSTNLDELATKHSQSSFYNAGIYPFTGYVNKFMFGVSAGIGAEFAFSELIGGEVKLSVSPDFTLQYNQPPIPNVIVYSGVTSISERRIRNTAIELSFGLRLLRKVIVE
jgi:hypothetical protein